MISTYTVDSIYTKLPPQVKKIAAALNANGKEAFLVGGAIRDALLGRSVHEYDMASNAEPDEIVKIFRRTVPTGIKHGTILVLMDGLEVELTTYRSDGDYSDGRRPDSVCYSETIEEDLSRRDFTINAIALNLQNGELLDLFDGERDLERGIIRTVGEPNKRFNEDGLRIMRACRFAAKLGFEIEEETFEAISGALDVFKLVSKERVRDELNGILLSADPARGIEIMRKSGILEEVLPELTEGYGVEQNKYHAYDVYYHNLYSCANLNLKENDEHALVLRLSALLHDVGKTFVKKKVGGHEEEVFYNHEVVGAAIARKIMRRLKYSRAQISFVDNMIRNHMFYYKDEWTDGAVRRFMRKVGVENIHALLRLREADRLGNGKKNAESRAVKKLLARIDKVIEEQNAIKVTDLEINGNDIINEWNVRPGPIIGKTLNHLLEMILDDPSLNEHEVLMQEAGKYLESEKAVGQ